MFNLYDRKISDNVNVKFKGINIKSSLIGHVKMGNRDSIKRMRIYFDPLEYFLDN